MTGESPASLEQRDTLAVVTLAGGATELRKVPLPELASGELELALRVCGLCGTDLFKLAFDSVPEGTVLGHELVGRVTALGPSTSWRGRIGDRVVVPHHVACGECGYCRSGSETMCEAFRENLMAPGGFAERIVVAERAVRAAAQRVPDGLSDASAVFLEPAACVLRGIERADLHGPAPSVAILGAGSMGLLHLLVLRALFENGKVLVVETLQERRRLAAELGATATCDVDLAELLSLRAAMAADRFRSGFDAVFDTVGGQGPLETGLALLRAGGTLVLFAHSLTGSQLQLDINRLFKAEQRIVATYSGSLREQKRIWEMIRDRRLDAAPLVTHRLPLSRFREAVELCRSRQALKVLLEPDE